MPNRTKLCHLVSTLALVATLSGCTLNVIKLQDFDPTQPVEIKEMTIGRSLNQQGQIINANQMVEHFQKSPNTANVMRHNSAYVWSGIGLAAVGGALVGWNVGAATHGEYVDYAAVAAGAAAIGSGYYLGTKADRQVEDAIKIHNKSVAHHQTRTLWLNVPLARW